MRAAMPQLPGVSHREITVEGVRLHVAEAGAGEAVVLQHGWPQNWWCWRRVIGPLSERHRVICPDLRGFGWSSAPARGYDKERLAADLLGVLDALELARPGTGERVRLIAHDWGAFAGFLACLRAPERFSGFLALSILHPWPPAGRVPHPAAVARLWYQFALASPVLGRRLVSSEAVVRRAMARAGEDTWDADTLDVYVRALARPESAHATVSLYRTFLTRELPSLLRGRYADRRLTVPTRLLVGDRDPVITPDTLAGYESHADAMSLELVPGATHWLPEQRPELVLEESARLP